MSPNKALQQARKQHQWHVFLALLKETLLPPGRIVPGHWPIMMLSRQKPAPHRTQAAPLASQEAV